MNYCSYFQERDKKEPPPILDDGSRNNNFKLKCIMDYTASDTEFFIASVRILSMVSPFLSFV